MNRIIRKIFLDLFRYIIQSKKKIYIFWYGKNAKHLKISTSDLFFQQNSNKGYNRLDIIVRYLAIENYFDQNDFGFELYNKMQEKRMGKDHAQTSGDVFKRLIKSWLENGYDPAYEIECDNNLSLLDGSHRLALALYMRVETVSCKVYGYNEKVAYGKEWFLGNGFTVQEIDNILDKYNEVCLFYTK